jgi:hypothetical protein
LPPPPLLLWRSSPDEVALVETGGICITLVSGDRGDSVDPPLPTPERNGSLRPSQLLAALLAKASDRHMMNVCRTTSSNVSSRKRPVRAVPPRDLMMWVFSII